MLIIKRAMRYILHSLFFSKKNIDIIRSQIIPAECLCQWDFLLRKELSAFDAVDFCSQNEVILVQSIYFVRPKLNSDFFV